jgi:hypothetical protein
MKIIDAIKARLGIKKDDINIVVDDIHARFLQDIAHSEGSAVQFELSSQTFSDVDVSDMLNDGLIYMFHRAANPDGSVDEDPTANWVVYSDKDRLARSFDPAVLQTLEKSGLCRASKHRSWD